MWNMESRLNFKKNIIKTKDGINIAFLYTNPKKGLMEALMFFSFNYFMYHDSGNEVLFLFFVNLQQRIVYFLGYKGSI